MVWKGFFKVLKRVLEGVEVVVKWEVFVFLIVAQGGVMGGWRAWLVCFFEDVVFYEDWYFVCDAESDGV